MALEIAGSLLGPVLEISKWVAAPIKRQLNYLCCFRANVTDLESAAVDEDSVNALERRVQSERNNLQDILPEVVECLKDINDIKEVKREIVNVEAPNLKGYYLKVRARYSVSKRAKKTTDRMKVLEGKCREFNVAPVISYRGQIAAEQETSLGTYLKFKSRVDIEELIMTKLRDGNVNMIGIWGMGGLGKTTMAKNVMNRVRKEGAFQEVVIAEVGEKVNEFNLQVEIGGQLGLELSKESREARVRNLKNRLSQPMKKTLLVLDNVWEKLKLEPIGIPCGSNLCTILITSRNEDDLTGIECSNKEIFKMEQLSVDDACRSLFKETAGSCVDRDELKPFAKEVVKVCGGLPISLKTVGSALRDKNDPIIWNTAVRRLKEDNPNIRDYDREVYNPLKLSYDALCFRELESIFLLCCLFPENVDIPLEYLTYICIGLRIFKGSQDLEDVKGDVLTGTEALKSRSLLLGSNKRDHVRIHDVVRYVGISIAESVAGKRHIGRGTDCTWRFSCKQGGERSRHLFLIRNSLEKELKFENVSSDDGIKDLYVMWIVNHSLTSLLPHSTQSLVNLNTLVLDSCPGLVEIPIVGALVNLEILICRHCGSIEELPTEIQGLERLKLLELTGCGKLERIRQGIISSLLSLEKLKMLGSFKKWEAKDKAQQENAGLRELEKLGHLTCLEIEIEDPALAAEDMHLSPSIKKFDIRIGVVSSLPPPFISHPSDAKLSLWAESRTCFGSWITKQLLRDTVCLYLRGNGANNVDFTNCGKLCWLELGGCRTMVEENPFRRHKVSASPFTGLQEIKISEHAGTMSLFTSSIATALVNLRVLNISHCDKMVRVIEGDEQVALGGETLFPKLEELELFSLRKLVSFCEWNSDVVMPSLRQVVIVLCPKMETFTSGLLLSPNLKIFKVNYEDIGATEDLNGALQQYLAELFNDKQRSRRDIEEDIMTALRGREHSVIGICGMGGLGKTTMAKRIINRLLDEHVFDETAMAVVSLHVDKFKILNEIGVQLGLMLQGETSLGASIQKMHKGLTGERRILLVLDDVWGAINLEDFGIPRDSKGCKILLTSRNIDALRQMDVGKIFQLGFLSLEEAWFLFEKSVGTCVSDTKLNSVAKQVVIACGGLPLSLITVGKVLKDEKNEFIWRDVLSQLRQSYPDIPRFMEKVYNPIKLSYDYLESRHAKFLFLLCCMFPEDSDIPLEYLAYFCMGLGIFEDIGNVEQSRIRVFALTRVLKSRSLLLDSNKGYHVRMDNAVRHACIMIATMEGYIGSNDCAWTSSLEVSKGMEFPYLRLIFSSRNYTSAEEEFELNEDFLEGIRNLQVLCIQNYSLTSLPHSTQPLENFKTLVMDSCPRLMSISPVGELVNLEILICRDCDSIEELPQEIKRLRLLKLLDLTNCGNLQRIGGGIISSLVCLEELKMLGSFKKWEAEDRKEENAKLRELEALTSLRCLQIQVEDPALAEENIHLSSEMEIFDLRIGPVSGSPPSFISHPSNRKLSLCVQGQSCLGHWIEKQLLRETDCLYLSGNGANNLNLSESRSIRWLESGGYNTINVSLGFLSEPNLGNFTADLTNNLDVAVSVSFNSMKELLIMHKENPVYHHKIYVSLFSRLEELRVSQYHGSNGLFTYSILQKLTSLTVLTIENCDEMVKAIEDEVEEVVSGVDLLPKLEELRLEYLHKMVSFCEWKCDIQLPSLRKVVITRCPCMKLFTLGYLGTPNLGTVIVEGEDIGGTKDLNYKLLGSSRGRRRGERNR